MNWSTLKNTPPTPPSKEVRLLVGRARVRGQLLDRVKDSSYYVLRDEDLVIPITKYEELDFNPQVAIQTHLKDFAAPLGTFATSFPNLDTFAPSYGNVGINQIDNILKELQARAGGNSFEAFGVKFPAEATTRWGILIILSVQMYLWIHLHELKQKLQPDDPGWEVAFIGMYSSWPSQIVYFITSYLLPVFAIIALGVKGIHIGENRAVIANLITLGTAVSLLLSFAIWKSSPHRPKT